jgi:L-ascorbate metabolism protein UlaG (beta-lactamase superfamily)
MNKSGKALHPMAMMKLRRAEKKGRRFQNPVETKVGGLSIMLQLIPKYLTNREERFPREPLGPFRTDPRVYRTWPRSGLRVTWMGHASSLMEIDGVRVLMDPVWEERASPFSWMGPKRFFDAPLRLEDLPRIDAVLVSHDHYDHLGKETVGRLAKLDAVKEAQWVTSVGVGKMLRKFGVSEDRIAELDWTQSVAVKGQDKGVEVTITAVPARHFSGRSLWNRFETLWSSFVLVGARHRVFYGADSGMWDGFADIGQEYGPFDLTMLEVGAYNDLWRSIHMGPEGAAKAFAAMGGSGLLMPIHWGLFDLALHAWRDPIEKITALADKIGMRLWSPEPGAPTEVIAGRELRSGWWKGRI